MPTTLAQGRDATRQLMDEWSNNGTLVNETIGAQKDYILRMPMYFDIAQKKIAQAKYIIKTVTTTNTDTATPFVDYTMPADFHKLVAVRLHIEDDIGERYVLNPEFGWKAWNVMIVPYALDAEYEIEYAAMPTSITSATLDTYTFEVSEDVVQGIFEYTAAKLLEKTRPDIAGSLMDAFNERLINAEKVPHQSYPTARQGLFGGLLRTDPIGQIMGRRLW